MSLDIKLKDLKICKFVKKTKSKYYYCSKTNKRCNKFILPEECDLNKSYFNNFIEKLKKNYRDFINNNFINQISKYL